MAYEVERRFLVDGARWSPRGTGERIVQGYIPAGDGATVRVRRTCGAATLTIKGPKHGAARLEFEYEIPLADAVELLDRFCVRPHVEKTRYLVDHAGDQWQVDVFTGRNDGLIIAEYEIRDGRFDIARPHWVTAEITDQDRYRNSKL